VYNLQSLRGRRRAVDTAPDVPGFDRLTGLASRKLFEARLYQQWRSSQVARRSLALILVDFDHFRSFRSAHHKSVANGALANSARILSQECRRRADFAGRLRMSEFACLLIDVQVEGALYVAEKLRAGIEALKIVLDEAPAAKVLTVSVAVVCLVPPASHFSGTLLIAADEVLKQAKHLGRNRIEVATRL
jgi:diguanylate cyclase (GGDEF)-like protein